MLKYRLNLYHEEDHSKVAIFQGEMSICQMKHMNSIRVELSDQNSGHL